MTLRVDVLTLFPEALTGYADTSVLGRARERGVWELFVHDFRDAADDVHRSVDDTPYGGGAGMVLRPEPVARSIEDTGHRPDAVGSALQPRDGCTTGATRGLHAPLRAL